MSNHPFNARRITALSALTGLLVSVGSFFSVSVSAEEPKEAVITVQALSYSPSSLSVETGTTVVWKNAEALDYPVLDGTHRAVAVDGSFDTGDMHPGQQFAYPFLKPGTFAYKCVIHPGLMDGAITVTGDPIEEIKDVAIGIVEREPTDTDSWGFDPAKVTIAAGTKVTWRNNGSQAHTVTAEDGSFDSKSLAPGQTFVKTFDKAASFRYKCTPHPWMTGIIGITGKDGAAPPPPPPVERSSSGPIAPPVQVERTADAGPITLNVQIVEPSMTAPKGWGFTPRTLNARAGDRVIWTNTGSTAHTVTAADGSFDSGDMAAGETFERVLDTTGTFAFACKPHPWMTGTLVVAAASAARPIGPPVDEGIGVDKGSAGEDGTTSGSASGDHGTDSRDAARRNLALVFCAAAAAFALALIAPSLKNRPRPQSALDPASFTPIDLDEVPLAETRELVGSGAK